MYCCIAIQISVLALVMPARSRIKTQEDLIVSLQSQVGIDIENCVPLRDEWTTTLVALLLSWLFELPFQTLGSRCFLENSLFRI